MKIEINKKYLPGLRADTDLHAGGLFFCIIYQNQLEFFENGKVELTKRFFTPMHWNGTKKSNCLLEYQYKSFRAI
ncbi:hypothetical protein [Flavobacterium sp. HJSW_4]|uniref:hypothetical protein n=1 Tax=Flavobacterium sp. HJSW_4 TaxID=3344660 RepID=UPI0035F36859